jgi:nucleotide-binding universal stress UspA family protein
VLVLHNVKRGNNAPTAKSSPPSLNFKNILVPVDFSDCSKRGLEYARRLARDFGSKLILLNSVAPEYYVSSDEYARYDLPRLMRETAALAREQMRNLIQKTDWEGIEVESCVQDGHPGDQICAAARDHAIDIIVTATHGRTGLKHVWIGSTAEYVVRHAPCPVLVVPSHERPVLDEKNETP